MNWKHITLSGTLMNKDIPLAEFEISHDMPIAFKKLCEDMRMFPWRMQQKTDGYSLIETLLSRVTPASRQGVDEAMQALGFSGYDVSELLKFSNANSWDDSYWVRFVEGPQTWEEVQRKAGFTTY